MKRCMIVGQPGSRKSWLAREIGRRSGLPVHHMDMIHWLPGWAERPKAEKIIMARAVEESPAWVFEGGLSATYATRLSRADTLIVLDVPFLLRVWRVFWRTLRQWGKTRPDLPDGCPERFDLEFWTFIWTTRNTARQRNLHLAWQTDSATKVYILRTRREVRAFLKTLDAPTETGQETAHGTAAY
jgi:adenylate kinase family enzyme